MADEYKSQEVEELDAVDFVARLTKFDGGLVDNIEPDLLKPEESSLANNVMYDNHIINMRKGSQYFGNELDDPFLSLYYFVKY